MKILFSDTTLMHGGAERVISILSNYLVAVGHEVEILLYYDKPIWYELDNRIVIKCDENIIGKTNPLKHIRFRRDYFKKSDADIIISFLAPMNIINILSVVGTKKKIIVADRNDPKKIPVNPIMRLVRNYLYRFADGIVLQSKNNKNYFSKSVQKKSEIIYNPVDIGEYSGIAIQCPKNDEIVAVGRIIRQKNPLMLIRAFSKISPQFPTYNLTLYGEGDMMDEVKKTVSELGIQDKVTMAGAVHDVFDKIKSAKLYVMTSDYEGMPNALIEAMCVGLPVISTKVSGAVDLISDGINGRLVDCDDEDELASIMTEILNDDQKANQYATNAKKLNDLLNVDTIVNQWITFINKVCE